MKNTAAKGYGSTYARIKVFRQRLSCLDYNMGG